MIRRTDEEIDRWTYRQTDRCGGLADRKTNRQTYTRRMKTLVGEYAAGYTSGQNMRWTYL